MSTGRFIKNSGDIFSTVDLGNSFKCYSDEESTGNDGNEDSDFLQDVPYSSSSLDRSSIGSIPWSYDAIKKNELDWERVESMLHGEEEPDELDLRNEIIEWQTKFPHLLRANVHKPRKENLKNSTHNDVLDLCSMSNLSLNTNDDNDDVDKRNYSSNNASLMRNNLQSNSTHTLFHDVTKNRGLQTKSNKNFAKSSHKTNKDFQTSSVPLKLSQRYATNRSAYSPSTKINPAGQSPVVYPEHRPINTQFTMDSVFESPPISPDIDINCSNDKAAQFHMPPILNMLQSKRRFRDLLGSKRSFVQLTHVQEGKSPAATVTHSRKWQSAVWHLPAVSNRFLNYRDSTILPSINPPRKRDSTLIGDTSDPRRYSFSSATSAEITGRRETTPFKLREDYSLITTPASTSSTGRSISAALHPRNYEFNALYLPYNVSKFKILK